MKNKLYLLIMPLFYFSCRMNSYNDVWLIAQNGTDDSVTVYVALGYPANPSVYPDTLLPPNCYVGWHETDSVTDWMITLPPRSKDAVWFMEYYAPPHNYYYNYFREILPYDTLSVFFMSKDSINKYGYNHIAIHNMILFRYDLSVSDLELLDYSIPYPPNVLMKERKMKLCSYETKGQPPKGLLSD